MKFTAAQKDEIKKQAIQFWDKASEDSSDFFNEVNEYERLARGLLPQELEDAYAAYADRSALVPPDIHNNLNAMRAHLRKVLFSKRPYYKLFHAGNPYLRDETLRKAEQTLQRNCDMENRGAGHPSLADKIMYQSLYCGITCTFKKWVQRKERVVRRDPNSLQFITDDEGKPIFDKKMVAEYCEEVPLDIRRVRIDPRAAEVKDIRIIGYHGLRTFSELRALNRDPESGYEFDEQKLWESAFNSDKYFEYAKGDTLEHPNKSESEPGVFGDKQIEVYSIRGLFRFDRGAKAPDFKDLIVELGNRTEILSIKENDLPLNGWDLFKFPRIDEQHGRMYTMGLIEPARDVFIEQFIKHNQSIDAANRNTYVTWIGDASACQSLPPYIETSNDQLLKIDLQSAGLDDVRRAITPLQRPELGQDTFAHANVLKTIVRQTMRMSNYLMGEQSQEDETATGVAALVSGGEALTEHVILKLCDTWLNPSARDKLIMWNFFKADEEHVIWGQDGMPYRLEPGEIDLPFTAAVDTSIAATHPSQVRRMIEAYPIISNDPFFDSMEVRRTFIEVMGLPNQERLLRNAEHLSMIIARENSALMYGITLPVHPLDDHSAHIPEHVDAIDYVQSLPPEVRAAQRLETKALEEHIMEHQGFIDQQQQALGNTKEMGGNSGNLVQPDSASMSNRGRSARGSYLPSQSRR